MHSEPARAALAPPFLSCHSSPSAMCPNACQGWFFHRPESQYFSMLLSMVRLSWTAFEFGVRTYSDLTAWAIWCNSISATRPSKDGQVQTCARRLHKRVTVQPA
jgi:hypothetical protein